MIFMLGDGRKIELVFTPWWNLPRSRPNRKNRVEASDNSNDRTKEAQRKVRFGRCREVKWRESERCEEKNLALIGRKKDLS